MSFFARIIPKSFSARLIAITLLSGLIPLIIFGLLMGTFVQRVNIEANNAIQQGQNEQWRRSQSILNQMAEEQIRQKAFDVALQIELYLLANPGLGMEELQNDLSFEDIAVQPVGKTGYTAVHDSVTAVVRFHRNQAIVNSSLHDLAQKIPEFWAIIKAGLNGRIANGYYTWHENDGSKRQKYMYLVPVTVPMADGTLLTVGATAYKDEFSRPIQVAKNVSEGTKHLLIKMAAQATQSFYRGGYVFIGISFVMVLLLACWAGYYFSKAVNQLREAIQSVNRGDLEIELKPVMTGDVGSLTLDFNRMVQHLAATTVKKEKLEVKELELKRYQDQLEDLVKERTSELTQANILLSKEVEERRQAVEALQENERKLRAILHAIPDGIGMVVNRRLGWANDRMYQLLGYEKDSLLGSEAIVLYPDNNEYEKVGKKLYDLEFSAELCQITTRLKRKDGTVFDCDMRAYPLDTSDLSKGQMVSINDITDSKLLENRLQQARKMEALGTLAGGVAHDLNNILSGLVTYPELLLLDLPKDSPIRLPLMTIKKAGDQAAAIVQDLLTMTRRGIAVFETLNLNAIAKEQMDTPEFSQFRRHHPEVTITERLDQELFNIKGSAAHLAKAIMNMINNAAEAMSHGGTITISTKNLILQKETFGYEQIKPGDYATISIKDEGVGISAADLPRIFEPFFTKKMMGRSGSGLGMAVVWGTVKDHNGYIDIATSEAAGTKFTLFFPVSYEKLKNNRLQTEVSRFAGAGESILVVDDLEEQREIARSLLQRLGYTVHCLESGEKAIEYLHEANVDIVLLDMLMEPGLDGLETYKRISVFKPDQRIVIASGFSESEQVRELQKLSGCIYIKKPYTLELIGEAVKRTLA